MFPRRAALVAALTGAVVYWTTGLGPAAALAVSLTTFLPLGGARYLSLLYRVLPRDVKLVLLAVKARRRLKYYQDKKFNLFDIFCEVTSKHPHKTAIICVDDGRKWTFAELEKYAGRVACYFSSIGVAKGDVVAVFVENCPEHIGTFFYPHIFIVVLIFQLCNTISRTSFLSFFPQSFYPIPKANRLHYPSHFF
ncbi:Long-chain fatty acid transport protein 1 [Geodia barretti]|uniref:Long-chain-fatty-acid--CoA ligase n=1 Tax=Geodia barretti TaxID=519541 RepID=A0AA35T3G2_GEOBA|nr:Long-chain fatty acid transport protein 1 [Geodia barretti]